ncbi:hypothetical protein [Gluconobacter cerinus]|uniref:hypothetical protein n=1 Tax=Gluconobacter cerinus TaxID=38307 RepID=UPI0024E0C7CD|nr:hypothetical protein [Gluconobacter cerinus]
MAGRAAHHPTGTMIIDDGRRMVRGVERAIDPDACAAGRANGEHAVGDPGRGSGDLHRCLRAVQQRTGIVRGQRGDGRDMGGGEVVEEMLGRGLQHGRGERGRGGNSGSQGDDCGEALHDGKLRIDQAAIGL